MIVVGVDIGLSGGIAAVCGDVAQCWEMPTLEREVGGKKRRRIDPDKLARLIGLEVLGDFDGPGDGVAFIEDVHATPQMGVSSAFNFGEAKGIVIGVLAHLGVPMRQVSPMKWKRAMGLLQKGRELGDAMPKASSIEMARKLYPQLRMDLNQAKDDGKAEALLIAHYGCEELGI